MTDVIKGKAASSKPRSQSTRAASQKSINQITNRSTKRKVVNNERQKKKAAFTLKNTMHLSSAEKIQLIKNGFSKNELEDIKKVADLDYDTLSSLLSVSRATLLKKKGGEKFDQATSERIMLLADLISFGHDVFEDENKFNIWIRKSNKALGMKTPLEMMDTLYGIDEVKKEIGRIEYGIF